MESKLAENLSSIPRWKAAIEEAQDRNSFYRREFGALIDYLIRYLAGDATYRELYIGERRKHLYQRDQDVDSAISLRRKVTADDGEAYRSILIDQVGNSEIDLLTEVLNEIHNVLAADAPKQLSLLFVGDCLFLDILAFLTSQSLEDGIVIDPYFSTSKNPSTCQAEICAFGGKPIDITFFSPYSYEFSILLAPLLDRHTAAIPQSDLVSMAEQAVKQANSILDTLVEHVGCTHLVVHNTAMLVREESSIRRFWRSLRTRRNRRFAAEFVNKALDRFVDLRQPFTSQHLMVLRQDELIQQHGEYTMGKYLYRSELQHPAETGRHLAKIYRDILYVKAYLMKKKLVVCDLDNTLWSGVIGEGEVHHFLDRQRILSSLRSKGILLAIASKNDPSKVHFDGGRLQTNDFVASEISWDPKVKSIRRIASELNLNPESFLFVDDRSDERQLVAANVPGVLTLDATDDRTWRILECWSNMITIVPEIDRTQLYRDRESRNKFLTNGSDDESSGGAIFQQLDLSIEIRHAENGDLKRAVELVNRTNQFNCQGSRTNLRELRKWMRSETHDVIVTRASDRFGAMGMVSVLVCKRNPDEIQIKIFVLSCRVFGYEIDKAILNWVKRKLSPQGKPILPIRGTILATPQNQPCREVYQRNGFLSQDEGQWLFNGEKAIEDVPWLTITDPSSN